MHASNNMNIPKRSTNQFHKKRPNIINSSNDNSDKQTTQPSEANQDDNKIVDTTEAENAKRQEAINKISQYKLINNLKNTYCGLEKDLLKQKALIYAFFDAEPEFEFTNDRAIEYLVWRCMHCAEKTWQGVKTKDKGSTGQWDCLDFNNAMKKC